MTLILFYPKTGRTHQLRVHSKFIGHPILNDDTYSKTKIKNFNDYGQFLHAYSIKFWYNGIKQSFTSKIPNEFLKLEPNIEKILQEQGEGNEWN